MMRQTKSFCKLEINIIAGLLVTLNLFKILYFGLFQRSLQIRIPMIDQKQLSWTVRVSANASGDYKCSCYLLTPHGRRFEVHA